MQKVNQQNYPNFIDLAAANTCNTVYPLSVAEQFQSGDIYTDCITNPNAALFWHQSGFAYLSGTPDEDFLNATYDLLSNKNGNNPRRFVLEIKDANVADFFRKKENVVEEPRYRFKLREDFEQFQDIIIPDGFEVKEIDANLLPRISGKIVPSAFWRNSTEFLNTGKGFCVVKDEEIAAVAFSAAISHNQIDIGIETNEKFRCMGLAAIVAKKMIQYAISIKKEPVWDCNAANAGSRRTAEKVGFQVIANHSYFVYQND